MNLNLPNILLSIRVKQEAREVRAGCARRCYKKTFSQVSSRLLAARLVENPSNLTESRIIGAWNSQELTIQNLTKGLYSNQSSGKKKHTSLQVVTLEIPICFLVAGKKRRWRISWQAQVSSNNVIHESMNENDLILLRKDSLLARSSSRSLF